jgi:xanthine dehydrogenase accessory factor
LRPSAFAGMDREVVPLVFLERALALGLSGALVTISEIDGGAPKSLGTHMAVLEDGRHIGDISGGCVEPAIAAEFAPLIATGKDRIMRFGRGSRLIDIRFPCGGGIDLLLHACPSADLLKRALECSARRKPFSIHFDPSRSVAAIREDIGRHSGWHNGVFVRRYLPRTRLLLIGRGPDFEVMARVAAAAEFELALLTPDKRSAAALADLGAPIEFLQSPGQLLDLPIDPWTATVLLFHEHDWENGHLVRAAGGAGFYVGALGSVRTHQLRRERLSAMGIPQSQIDRIHGPIGVVERARDPGTLALSVLAEISAARTQLDQH